MLIYAVVLKSFLNPIVYTFGNKEMKNAIRKIGKILIMIYIKVLHLQN